MHNSHTPYTPYQPPQIPHPQIISPSLLYKPTESIDQLPSPLSTYLFHVQYIVS